MNSKTTDNNLPTKARTAELLDSIMLDRRRFLMGSAALTAGATLGAWVPEARAEIGGNLEIMAWEGYTMEKETEEWRKQHNLTVRAAIMASQDDVTAKIVGDNAVRLDAAEYSNGYNAIYNELKVLTPLDTSKVPNYTKEDIYPPFYQGDMWHWDETQWAIPWCWGLDTIVINPELAGTEVKSYTDLLKPELKGKVAFLDNPLTLWPQIAKVTGYGDKFPNMTKDELTDCMEKLKPYRDQTKVFASSNGDVISLFASGEIAACFCVWSAVPLETAKQNVKTVAIYPTEGGAVWADAWFIPKNAENIDSAYAYINQALDPQVQASVSKTAVCSTVSKKAVPLMDETTKALFDYANFDEQFKHIRIYGQPPRTSDQYATYDDWLQVWADFRQGF
ncbi:extracellular solute-binding protein [Mesorhizobium sp. M7A.F.Ca.US.011.01.1.1]|uniref:ABC transporter substrate-binding protein n=1 Tax=Mesorhizobium sp. M7A.F.Ca.US.011.01.1.1 TaxID=2496741 RepID=UPI000FCCD679|nr:substrate-binding domain-containing protein [Mesorhizobium sp. M7A.F.Ca.US.011.01.1.1]RUX21817.1 extracellular solute-binding protein [Mesorhizobium sp. M7A.F.Ca.US.011.01.1.1]